MKPIQLCPGGAFLLLCRTNFGISILVTGTSSYGKKWTGTERRQQEPEPVKGQYVAIFFREARLGIGVLLYI